MWAKAYLAGADPRTPLANPLYADLHGLPPLLIQVGDHEVCSTTRPASRNARKQPESKSNLKSGRR